MNWIAIHLQRGTLLGDNPEVLRLALVTSDAQLARSNDKLDINPQERSKPSTC